MKNIKYYFLTVIFALTVSCQDGSDFLDPEAVTGLTPDEVFTNALNTMKFLDDIYGRIVPVHAQGGNRGSRWPGTDAMLEVATDNAVSYLPSGGFLAFNVGLWSPLSTLKLFSCIEWENDWAAIRACNLFLSKIDRVPENSEYGFNNQTRVVRKGECIFLKAFFYSELFKQFGGLPLLDRVVELSDKMDFPRNSVDETVEYIVNLCDEAALILPATHPELDYGRATKGAALALKARVLLYAASPLWNNPEKQDDSPFRGRYDQTKWRKAAEAAAEVIGMNVYSLHPDISDLFTTRVNSELIFVRLNQPGIWMTFLSIPNRICLPGRTDTKSGVNQVTWNLIREYEILKNGQSYLISDDLPTDIYDPQNPFVNRDPRFYRDCMFNGYLYLGETARFGLAEGGVARPPHNPSDAGAFATYTFCVKFADVTIPLTGGGRSPAGANAVTNQNYPYLRYAEILLNYAEAMNEAFGPDVDGLSNGKTALWAINQVRARAKYPNKPEYMGYTGGLPSLPTGLSQNDFRERIRRERRIEMAFEEHRFWDVRRWKVPASELTKIEGLIPIWGPGGVVRYEIITIEERVFDPKMMYRMAIRQEEINKNPNLVQNPGWQNSPEQSE